MTNVIVIIEIIEEVNVKLFTLWLEKKFLLDVNVFDSIACLCCKSKFIINITAHEVFSFGQSIS